MAARLAGGAQRDEAAVKSNGAFWRCILSAAAVVWKQLQASDWAHRHVSLQLAPMHFAARQSEPSAEPKDCAALPQPLPIDPTRHGLDRTRSGAPEHKNQAPPIPNHASLSH